MKLLDYTFYRIYQVYKKKDSNPIFMGCLVLSLLLCLTSLFVLVAIQLILKMELRVPKLFLAPIMLAFTWLFWRRFKNDERLLSLDEKHKAEEARKRAWNGLFIVGYIFIVLLIPILYGVLKHNLHYDI